LECNLKVCFAFKPDRNTATYFNYKQKTEDNKKSSGVVYGVTCEQCPDPSKIQYIGETSRRLRDRINSHFTSQNPSSLKDHKKETGHNSFKYLILAKEDRAAERKIIESLLINKFKPSLNKDQGIKLYVT